MTEDPKYFERRFRDALSRPLSVAGLHAAVFIWRRFHDRFLISNVVGISLPNGFDVSRAPGDFTTWTRLGRNTRDELQRDFDPVARPDELVERFEVPT